MFTTIQPHEVGRNIALVTEIFKLRKAVFADQLNWDVPVNGDLEIDEYDELDASYLVWCSNDRSTLYGVVRLMSTAGPTLLHDVFGDTHNHSPELISRDIWEGTRMCVNEAMIARDFPTFDAGHGFRMMLLALCEAALDHGISRMVSNFEPAMSRVYRRAGLGYDLHGKADGYGKQSVCCASFAVTKAVLAKMRTVMGIDLPLYRRSATAISLVSHDHDLEAA